MIQTAIKTTSVDMDERKRLNLSSGMTVRVWQKIEEKGKTRLQAYEGLVIAVKHGNDAGATFTVRKVASGVGMEKIFPLYSPNIDRVEIVKHAKTRRAKLYYIRDKATKEVRRRIKQLSNEVLAKMREEEAQVKKEQEEAKLKAENEAKAKSAEDGSPKAKETEAAAAESSSEPKEEAEANPPTSGTEEEAPKEVKPEVADAESSGEPKADSAQDSVVPKEKTEDETKTESKEDKAK